MKLFVGQISKQSSEDELRPTFEPFGTIIEFVILRDKMNVSKGGVAPQVPLNGVGCAFLTYATRASALECIEALHDKHVFPGVFPRKHWLISFLDDPCCSSQARRRRATKIGGQEIVCWNDLKIYD